MDLMFFERLRAGAVAGLLGAGSCLIGAADAQAQFAGLHRPLWHDDEVAEPERFCTAAELTRFIALVDASDRQAFEDYAAASAYTSEVRSRAAHAISGRLRDDPVRRALDEEQAWAEKNESARRQHHERLDRLVQDARKRKVSDCGEHWTTPQPPKTPEPRGKKPYYIEALFDMLLYGPEHDFQGSIMTTSPTEQERERQQKPPSPPSSGEDKSRENREIGRASPAPGLPSAIPVSTTFEGAYVGLNVTGIRIDQHVNEYSVLTGELTDHYQNATSSLAGGGQAGYTVFPFNPASPFGNFNIGGVVSVEGFEQRNRKFFTPETYAGIEANFTVSVLGKLGYAPDPHIQFYVLGGWTVLPERLQIHLGEPLNTDVSRFTSGGTVGAGFEVQTGWRLAGGPVTANVDYTHTFFADQHLNQPDALPFSNLRFRLASESVRFGLNWFPPL